MAYKLLVNIKDKKTDKHLKTLGVLKSYYNPQYLYNFAIDKVQNYFGRYLKPFEIRKGTYCTSEHMYWSVTPQHTTEKATITITKE